MARIDIDHDDDPNTYTNPGEQIPGGAIHDTPAPPKPSYTLPSGVTREQAEDFLRRNPGDEARLASAFQSTSHRTQDSQSGQYDTRTYQPLPGTQAALTAAQNAGRTNFNFNAPGDQFDDPYTKSLEDLLKQQLASLQQPQTNPALDNLLKFLNTQFAEKSQNPGYTTAEQALLRTQALDPIEQDRSAALRRSQERISERGFLPSSGLAELQDQQIDLGYDQLRGAAQRDLGINAINRRDQNLAQALTLGQLAGVQIPQLQRAEDQSRRNEAVQLASLLYQLPRNAMNDSLAVLNGSPSSNDLFSQAIQLMSAQENQRRYDQQQQQAFWESIGQALSGIFS